MAMNVRLFPVEGSVEVLTSSQPARRGTPESETVVSSEDERPWPSSMSFGKFPMKENGVPGLPGGIWSTGKRGSFKLSEAAHRNAARDARLGAVNPAVAAGLRGTPSPSSTEGAGSLPFAIPLQPTPKTGRSLSHSQGQREVPQGSGQHSSTSGHGGALPLGLLTEEVDTESESELGSRLTHTTSHPPMSSLMRTATLPATYDYHGNGGDAQDDGSPSSSQPGLLRGRTFESAFANLSLEHPRQRTHWQSHLGWDDVPNVNESRRHSLADIPTRRGSLAGGEPSHLSRAYTVEHAIDDAASHYSGYGPDRSIDTNSDHNLTRHDTTTGGHHIPPMYIAPTVELLPHERNEIEARREQMTNMQWGAGGGGRPRKQLYIVSFKCSRVDVFYLLENTGLQIREGDLVIVEADRGQDLGTVQHAKVTPDAARILKKRYSEEQYKWLMMYSRNKDGGFNPNAQLHGENSGFGQAFADAPATMQGTIPRDNFNNLKPKAIKRLANEHEIKMLAEKEGNEAKAKRTCQQKVAHLRLQMEILDAEWQWDFQKLIFYYYADHYINFKDLITELYRIYKTRIWLSAINPASFSQHAVGQPPSGLGPGALPPYNPHALNNAYTMAYGEDRDPYGAQMPYSIPYDTYTPNFPGIPGVTNSFPPPAYDYNQGYMFYSQNAQGGGSTMTANPSTTQTADETTPTTDAHNTFANAANYGAFFEPPTPVANRPSTLAPQLSFEQVSRSSQPDLLGRHFEAASGRGYAARLNENASGGFGYGHGGNSAGVIGRPSGLPNPIGTARPNSQGTDWTAGVRQSQGGENGGRRKSTLNSSNGNNRGGFNGNIFLPQSAMSNNNAAQRDGDEAAGRVQTMDHFLSQLPPPSNMSNDTPRER